MLVFVRDRQTQLANCCLDSVEFCWNCVHVFIGEQKSFYSLCSCIPLAVSHETCPFVQPALMKNHVWFWGHEGFVVSPPPHVLLNSARGTRNSKRKLRCNSTGGSQTRICTCTGSPLVAAVGEQHGGNALCWPQGMRTMCSGVKQLCFGCELTHQWN